NTRFGRSSVRGYVKLTLRNSARVIGGRRGGRARGGGRGRSTTRHPGAFSARLGSIPAPDVRRPPGGDRSPRPLPRPRAPTPRVPSRSLQLPASELLPSAQQSSSLASLEIGPSSYRSQHHQRLAR